MTPKPTLASVISEYGANASKKLSNPAISGEPEDQLRAPFESLLAGLARLAGFTDGAVVAVGETSLADLKTRPDYAVTVSGASVGFVEVKAPGKGADPRKFRDKHDRLQWEKLRALPNLVYTDGNEFSLWRDGELVGKIVELDGDVASAGAKLAGSSDLLALAEDFLRWQPTAPRTAKHLAELTARLCRLLRDEVEEQLAQGSPALTDLAKDWRRLLFPEASDKQFADGYAQAVTFGMLVARARGLVLADGLDAVAKKLGTTDSLIGTALRLLTDDSTSHQTLRTSMGTLVRVLDVVHWPKIAKGSSDAWLYFYEDFLEVYDNALRKLTGSYYTPPPVVETMVRLVNDALRSRFGLTRGLAAPNVTIADPAVGTGTYLLGVLRQIAFEVEQAEGAGAVPAAIDAAVRRLVGFELQLGPYAVAQLRIVAELVALAGRAPHEPLRMYVTDTLANPWAEEESLGAIYQPIAESRRKANMVKREESITVVVGNPPYKEKAKGMGAWVESGGENHPAPLSDWIPPVDWGVSAHTKHLRNLYVYFWRWATWKVFDADPKSTHGVVSFITMAGFLGGDGFQRMRAYLRQMADEVWVIDCSPEGHQPEVNSRIFQGVQQPICIVMASRSPTADRATPATVRFRRLPEGLREEKFAALGAVGLAGPEWEECDSDWRAPFLPKAQGAWAEYPALSDLFGYDGSGVMPGRTWVIAPDAETLERRWDALKAAPLDRKDALFLPHLVDGKPGDRHAQRVLASGLPGWEHRPVAVATDKGDALPPIRYAFRSFDRQWIIPDYRLINRPNPRLWEAHSEKQVYLTALERTSPSGGPAFTIAACIPDLHHYKGSFGGRVHPLWADAAASQSNVSRAVLDVASSRLGRTIGPEEFIAYLAAVAAHAGFTQRFAADLEQPGIRIPLSADPTLFARGVELGRRVIWLHTFGERCADPAAGRPPGAPRVTGADAPRIPKGGAIPSTMDGMPNELSYDPSTRRLHVGGGFVEHVRPEAWAYSVSGKQVVKQWFSYRRKDRERPVMGDRRPPSELERVRPERWLAEYTTDLVDLLHVLTVLVELEPAQAALLDAICAGPLISAQDLTTAAAGASSTDGSPSPAPGAVPRSTRVGRRRRKPGDGGQGDLL